MHDARPAASTLAIIAAAVLAACDDRAANDAPADTTRPAATAQGCDAPGVRTVVERFGERLQRVSPLAPDGVARGELRAAYAELVTPDLLAAWSADPASAPGRATSSPWPARIEVDSVAATAGGTCRVDGAVVYVTSVEAADGGAAAREPVAVEVVRAEDGWRIGAYGVASASDPAAADARAAVAVVRDYYAAIDARDFARAHRLWRGDGEASGQTLAEFAAGFAETARVEVEVGEPGRVEPAAGSRYVEVPVTVRARTRDGATQRFAGRYTLRRSVVDGATDDERRWRIHSATLARVE